MAFPLTSEEVWAATAARVGGAAKLTKMTGETEETHPNLDDAYATAIGEVGLYLSKRIDWPPDSMPKPFDADVINLTIDAATAGADSRPAWISRTAELARKRLSDVAAGRAAFADSDTGTAAGATKDPFGYDPPSPGGPFDTLTEGSEINRVLPPLFTTYRNR